MICKNICCFLLFLIQLSESNGSWSLGEWQKRVYILASRYWDVPVGPLSLVPYFNFVFPRLQKSHHITLPVHVRLKLRSLDPFWLGSKPVGIPLSTLCGWIVPLVPAKTRPLLWWVREAWKIHRTLHTALKPCLWPLCLKQRFGHSGV